MHIVFHAQYGTACILHRDPCAGQHALENRAGSGRFSGLGIVFRHCLWLHVACRVAALLQIRFFLVSAIGVSLYSVRIRCANDTPLLVILCVRNRLYTAGCGIPCHFAAAVNLAFAGTHAERTLAIQRPDLAVLRIVAGDSEIGPFLLIRYHARCLLLFNPSSRLHIRQKCPVFRCRTDIP